MNDIEYLASQITSRILLMDACAGKTIGDLTENDKDKKIYNSWYLICQALVPYILTHSSGSILGGITLWGMISGSISNQTDLYNIITNKENVSNKSNDSNLGTSSTLYPTQYAVKTYVDNKTKTIIESFAAGETISAGNICYLASDGKFYKALATSESTSKGLLALALSSLSTNVVGDFLILGKTSVLSGLSAGATYYLSNSVYGNITSTIPSTSGSIVRIVGYALGSNSFYFKPSEIYIELV